MFARIKNIAATRQSITEIPYIQQGEPPNNLCESYPL